MHILPDAAICKNSFDECALLQILFGMTDLLSPVEIEARAKAAGLTLVEVCRRAGIAPSTFSRWKAGKTEPTLDIYRRLRDATCGAVTADGFVDQHTAAPVPGEAA